MVRIAVRAPLAIGRERGAMYISQPMIGLIFAARAVEKKSTAP